MKKGASKPAAERETSEGISPDVMAQLRAAAAWPDDQIDTSDPDAPEAKDWSGATRGRFFRPVKKQQTLRIDADVLEFFKRQGPGYQTRINAALREWMNSQKSSRKQDRNREPR